MPLTPRKINPEGSLKATPEWLDNISTTIKERFSKLLWNSPNSNIQSTEIDEQIIDERLSQIANGEAYLNTSRIGNWTEKIKKIRDDHIQELIEMLSWYQKNLTYSLKEQNKTTQNQKPIQYITLYYIETLLNILHIQQNIHTLSTTQSNVKVKDQITKLIDKYDSSSQMIIKTVWSWSSNYNEIQQFHDKNNMNLKAYMRGIKILQRSL